MDVSSTSPSTLHPRLLPIPAAFPPSPDPSVCTPHATPSSPAISPTSRSHPPPFPPKTPPSPGHPASLPPTNTSFQTCSPHPPPLLAPTASPSPRNLPSRTHHAIPCSAVPCSPQPSAPPSPQSIPTTSSRFPAVILSSPFLLSSPLLSFSSPPPLPNIPFPNSLSLPPQKRILFPLTYSFPTLLPLSLSFLRPHYSPPAPFLSLSPPPLSPFRAFRGLGKNVEEWLGLGEEKEGRGRKRSPVQEGRGEGGRE